MKPIVTEAERFYTENPCLTDFHMHTHETYEIYFFCREKPNILWRERCIP